MTTVQKYDGNYQKMNRQEFNCLILEHFHHHDQCVIGGENLFLHKNYNINNNLHDQNRI